MMLYANLKTIARSLDGDTNFFDIVAVVLKGYISTIFFYILP